MLTRVRTNKWQKCQLQLARRMFPPIPSGAGVVRGGGSVLINCRGMRIFRGRSAVNYGPRVEWAITRVSQWTGDRRGPAVRRQEKAAVRGRRQLPQRSGDCQIDRFIIYIYDPISHGRP